jgi:hypothetical protein
LVRKSSDVDRRGLQPDPVDDCGFQVAYGVDAEIEVQKKEAAN